MLGGVDRKGSVLIIGYSIFDGDNRDYRIYLF